MTGVDGGGCFCGNRYGCYIKQMLYEVCQTTWNGGETSASRGTHVKLISRRKLSSFLKRYINWAHFKG